MSKTFKQQMKFNAKRSADSKEKLTEYFDKATALDDTQLENVPEFIKWAGLWLRELQGLDEEGYKKEIAESIKRGDGDSELEVLVMAVYG